MEICDAKERLKGCSGGGVVKVARDHHEVGRELVLGEYLGDTGRLALASRVRSGFSAGLALDRKSVV